MCVDITRPVPGRAVWHVLVVCAGPHACTHVDSHAYAHVYAHDYSYVCTHTLTHVHRNIKKHTYTCTHIPRSTYIPVHMSVRAPNTYARTPCPHKCFHICLSTSLCQGPKPTMSRRNLKCFSHPQSFDISMSGPKTQMSLEGET